MRHIVLILFLFCCSSYVYSQTFDFGVSYSKVDIDGFRLLDANNNGQSSADTVINNVPWDTTSVFNSHFILPGFYVGGNFRLIKLNDESAINFQPMANFGFAPETITVSIPGYITYKYGTDATLKSKSKIGFAIGLGLKFFGVASNDSWSTYTTPVVYSELNKVFNESFLLKLSFYYNLKQNYSKQFELNPDNIFNGKINIHQSFGILLGYTINF